MLSISQRLSLSAAIALVALFVAAGILLDRAFALSMETLVRDKLKLHTYVLLALAEYRDGRIDMPAVLSEQRFNTPDSGLIAFIGVEDEGVVWRSRSAQGRQFRLPVVASGEWLFGRAQDSQGNQYYVSVYGTRWQQREQQQAITFSVVEDKHSYDIRVYEFRRAIVIALLLFCVSILVLQFLVVRWSMRPLKQAARDVDAMNEGRMDSLQEAYPAELLALTDSLNRLVSNERRQRERYRDTLADLSHSLKTPLTILQGLAQDHDEQGVALDRDAVLHAVARHGGRMREIIDYQLQRASARQQNVSSAPTKIRPLLQSVVAALDKVYFEKKVDCVLRVDDLLTLRCDENDVVEVLGNVLDNAYKHCSKCVRVSASTEQGYFQICIEDDGAGIPVARRRDILQRGVRLDTRAEGQGFGLAIVADIVAAYEGEITIKESQWGGARFDIRLRG